MPPIITNGDALPARPDELLGKDGELIGAVALDRLAQVRRQAEELLIPFEDDAVARPGGRVDAVGLYTILYRYDDIRNIIFSSANMGRAGPPGRSVLMN